MRKTIISALVLSAVTANAQQQQVGINTAEPKATLHVEAGASENKGVIIPRITAAEMKTMTAGLGADHHSMMTYLKEQMPAADRTGKLVDVADPGYYFYNHTAAKWQKFGGGAEQDLRYINGNHITQDAGIGNNGASLGSAVGNIAIGPSTFYGFTNPADLSGSSNIAMGNNIYYNNGGTMQAYSNTGIGNGLFQMTNGGTMQGGNNVALGSGIYNLSKANAQFTGNSNFGIGLSLFNLNGDLTGYNNFAMGFYHFSPYNGNVTGYNNFAIGSGQFSPNGNVTGHDNFAIGTNSISAYSGDIGGYNNMGIGNNSISVHNGNIGGQSNMGIGNNSIQVINGDFSGQNNIALGFNSMYSNGDFTGNNNVAIGNQVLNGGSSGITGSNNVAIGNGYYSHNLGAGNGNIAILTGNGTDIPGVPDNVIIIGNGTSWGSLQDGTVAISTGHYNGTVLLGSNNNKVGVGGVTTPQTTLDVNGAIKIGNDNYYTCDSYQRYGIIRFDGMNFYGCTPSGWKQLNN